MKVKEAIHEEVIAQRFCSSAELVFAVAESFSSGIGTYRDDRDVFDGSLV